MSSFCLPANRLSHRGVYCRLFLRKETHSKWIQVDFKSIFSTAKSVLNLNKASVDSATLFPWCVWPQSACGGADLIPVFCRTKCRRSFAAGHKQRHRLFQWPLHHCRWTSGQLWRPLAHLDPPRHRCSVLAGEEACYMVCPITHWMLFRLTYLNW